MELHSDSAQLHDAAEFAQTSRYICARSAGLASLKPTTKRIAASVASGIMFSARGIAATQMRMNAPCRIAETLVRAPNVMVAERPRQRVGGHQAAEHDARCHGGERTGYDAEQLDLQREPGIPRDQQRERDRRDRESGGRPAHAEWEAAVVWSCVGALVYQFVVRPSHRRASAIVGLAVLSHWVLDLVVHVPDLALYDNSAKVGFGLWNAPRLAFGLEAALFLGGIALCLRGLQTRRGTLLFGVVALAIQAYNTFRGPPPASDRAFALTALAAYAAFAVVIWLLEDRRPKASAA